MSSFTVTAGLNKGVRLPDSQVVLIGRNKHIKGLNFDDLCDKLQGVDERVFKAAIEQLQGDGGSVPLYLDSAKVNLCLFICFTCIHFLVDWCQG